MLELYPEIHFIHVLAISLSGALMLVRGIARLAGMRWQRHVSIWIADWTILATLLTIGILLLTLLPAEMFANRWLTIKLLFVAVYLALGYAAIVGNMPRLRRLLCLAGAMLFYLLAYGVARAHDPWGWLALLTG